ncbi:MAG: hypothetical protein K9L22_09460 [Methylococcaceae bacterium]|nr:hypothetical protein [Methylococcaceae bacterium]
MKLSNHDLLQLGDKDKPHKIARAQPVAICLGNKSDSDLENALTQLDDELTDTGNRIFRIFFRQKGEYMLAGNKHFKKIAIVYVAMILSGCLVMRSYNDEITDTIKLVEQNQLTPALAGLAIIR